MPMPRARFGLKTLLSLMVVAAFFAGLRLGEWINLSQRDLAKRDALRTIEYLRLLQKDNAAMLETLKENGIELPPLIFGERSAGLGPVLDQIETGKAIEDDD